MATIYNSDLTKGLINSAKLQTSKDKVPNQIADKVVPVIEVNPKLLRTCNILRYGSATTTGATIYTTPSDQDFYLCGASVSVIKDVTSASTSSYLQITPEDGLTQRVLLISGITLTAQDDSISVDFSRPILLKRSSTIAVGNSSAVGNIKTDASIWGYTVDNS